MSAFNHQQTALYLAQQQQQQQFQSYFDPSLFAYPGGNGTNGFAHSTNGANGMEGRVEMRRGPTGGPQVLNETGTETVLLLNNKTFVVDKASSEKADMRAVRCNSCGLMFKYSQLRYHAFESKKCEKRAYGAARSDKLAAAR